MKVLKIGLSGFVVFIFFSFFCFIFASKTYAANWYVDNAATGTNAGTSWTDAWTSLAAIVWASVNPGDTVYISGGTTSKTYSESTVFTRSGTDGSPITIDIGANSPSPTGHNGTVIIDGAAGYCIRANGNYNYIKNLTCQNAIASGFRIQGTGTIIENSTIGNSYQQGIEVHFCTGCIVRGNKITTADDIAQQTDGIAIYDSSDTIVEKNWIKITNQNDCLSCHQDGIQASFTAASVYTNITIRYNYVENTKASTSNAQGIYVTLMQGDVKIYGNVVDVPIGGQAVASRLANSLPTNVYVVGNTIESGGYWALRVEDDNPVIKNNIIWQTGGSVGYVQNGALVRLDGLLSNDPANVNYNLYYAPYTSSSSSSFYVSSSSKSWDTWRTTYGLDANTTFLQDSTLDSCLRPASSSTPPVNSGVTLNSEYGSGLSWTLCGPTGSSNFLPVLLVDRSLSGGSAWDIGAYEYVPPIATVASSVSVSSYDSSPPGCNNAVGSGTPNLFEIHTTGSTATLYFTPPYTPYLSFYIEYSDRSDVWNYGVEYSQAVSGGVLQYTIRALKPNTTYYFRLRSGNGCATGTWGNTLSAKTTSSVNVSNKYYKNTPSVRATPHVRITPATAGTVLSSPVPQKRKPESPSPTILPTSTPIIEAPKITATPLTTPDIFLPSTLPVPPKKRLCILWWCF